MTGVKSGFFEAVRGSPDRGGNLVGVAALPLGEIEGGQNPEIGSRVQGAYPAGFRAGRNLEDEVGSLVSPGPLALIQPVASKGALPIRIPGKPYHGIACRWGNRGTYGLRVVVGAEIPEVGLTRDDSVFVGRGAAAKAALLVSGTGVAEVRTAPSAMSSKVVFKAQKYHPLTIKEKGAEYFLVSDSRGRSGYIHKSLLRDIPSVVVTADRANVRSGPGTANDVVFQLVKGVGALLLNKQDGWVEILATDGKTGWIADSLVWGD